MPSIIRNSDHVKEVWTSDDGSMAKETATSRWPKIVQGMIDDVERTTAQIQDGVQQVEGISIQRALIQMKNEILCDAPLRPLKSDGRSDIEGYNDQLAPGDEYSWLSCPWMLGECYLYRRVQTIFAKSQQRNTYDVFKRQKDSTFAKSRAAVEELSSRYIQITDKSDFLEEVASESNQLLFAEMTEIALWGNATDLSLLCHLSLEEIQDLQGRESIAKSQRNIVDNDIEQVWTYLNNPPNENHRIDIVLDNSGFEFFTDIIYALYFLESGIASTIKFHVKDFPWFVSDVTPSDVDSLFSHLESSEIFPNREDIDQLLLRLRKHFESGAIKVTQHQFWTTAYSYHEMPTVAPDLYQELKASLLVIFKGDLNYRKLAKDGLWPHTTPFKDAIGPLGAGSGLKVLALRTNKSDVCVGIDSLRKVKDLNEEAPDGAWVRNGKYAVISFSDGI